MLAKYVLRPHFYGEKFKSKRVTLDLSQVNFRERLYEKNVDPFASVKS